jgi:hypothetical protein
MHQSSSNDTYNIERDSQSALLVNDNVFNSKSDEKSSESQEAVLCELSAAGN